MDQGSMGAASGPVSPLADLFPGQTVKLSDGRVVTVRKWTARQVAHDVPAIMGRVITKMSAMATAGLADNQALMGALLSDGAAEILDLLAVTIKAERGSLDELGADEVLMLVRMMIEENWAFFVEATKIYGLTQQRLDASGTRSPSS